MKRINFTIENGNYIYPIDMSSAKNVRYSRDNSYCVADVDGDAPIATSADIDGCKQREELKMVARAKIREVKDIEDDLTDTKIILQWLAYAVIDIYSVLTDEQKTSMAYGDNIAIFAQMLKNPDAKLRVDVEPNQLEKIQKIFSDELNFAGIAKTEYLDKA